MINLLPPDEIENLGRERIKRFTVITGAALAGILALGILGLLPSYFFLLQEKKKAEGELEIAHQALVRTKVDYIEGEIEKFNLALEQFEANEQEARRVTEVFEHVINLRGRAIQLDTLVYARPPGAAAERISLEGRSLARQDLLDFASRLEASGLFKKVDLPVSNLLLERNIEFSLILEGKVP